MDQEGPLIHPDLANELERQLATLASVYHQTPSQFVVNERRAVEQLTNPATIQDLTQISPEDILGVVPPKPAEEPEELLIAF